MYHAVRKTDTPAVEMSHLPDWLWPSDDEEAVREAERLIRETEQTLQRLEIDMNHQRNTGLQSCEKTQKMKTAVDNKIRNLEKNLQGITVSTSNKKSSTHLERIPNHAHSKSTHRHKQPQSHVCKKNAETEVQAAREKVQGALRVAQRLSASLDSHPSRHLKSSVNKIQAAKEDISGNEGGQGVQTNVKVLEVKSKSADKQPNEEPKPRLQQSYLPVISIKRSLECQTIPPVHVVPVRENKSQVLAQNVAVHHFQYQLPDVDKASLVPEIKETSYVPKDPEILSQETEGRSRGPGVQDMVVNLGTQLAQIEELRELNQTQVNHVLRKASTQEVEQQAKHAHFQLSERSTSSSSSSQKQNDETPKIAYDSLSRFLETYRQAAEQSMRGVQKAALRRKTSSRQREEDIKHAKQVAANHLLIGPLRRAVQRNTEVPRGENSQTPRSSLRSKYNKKVNNQSKSSISSINSGVVSVENGSVLEIDENSVSSLAKKYSEHGSESKAHDIVDTIDLGSCLSSGGISNKTDSFCVNPVLSGTGDDVNSEENYEDDWEDDDKPKSSTDESEHFLPGSSPVKSSAEVKNISSPSFMEQSNLDQVHVQQMIEPQVCAEQSPMIVDTVKIVSTDFEQLDSNNGPGKKCNVTDNSTLEVLLQTASTEQQHSSGKLKYAKSTPLEPMPQPLHQDVAVKTLRSHKICQTASYKSRNNHSDSSSISSIHSDSGLFRQCCTATQTQKDWNLRIKDDLHLRSSVLLKLELNNENDESREGKAKEVTLTETTKELSTQCKEITEVELQWKKKLEDLQEKVRAMEEQEKINRAIQEHRLRTIEEQDMIRKVIEQEHHRPLACAQNQTFDIERTLLNGKGTGKYSSPSPEEYESHLATKVGEQHTIAQNQTRARDEGPHSSEFVTDIKEYNQPFNGVKRTTRPNPTHERMPQDSERWLHLLAENLDSTDKLLAYGCMGPLGHRRTREHLSSVSSTVSSVHSQPSWQVSLSDGELRASCTGSCSEGEVCSCKAEQSSAQGQERAAPDGSHAFCEREPVLNDMSQGELPLSEVEQVPKDVSQGEIPVSEMFQAETTSDETDLENSSASTGTDWESRHS